MKAPLHKPLGLGLLLAALPWLGACNPQASNAPAGLVTAAQAEPVAATTNAPASANTNAPVAADAAQPETPQLSAKPAPAPDAERLKLPEHIKPSAALSELIKLAQAGVDDSVMLSYVTNSQYLFKLGADEIIYLKDLGVPDNVVTAMIEHDRVLQQALNETAQAAAQPAATPPTVTAEAAAPSYVNPPAAQPAETTAPTNVTYNYNYFYNALSPYGSWIEVDGYGWCWRPTVVLIEHDWRPYCHGGRWLYTDLGWYWHSYYSWGWIAFHYGRWFHHPRWGWCWYPDYVWAPAWVTWRYSPGYCGWAPLPPGAFYRPGAGFFYHGRSVGFGFDFGLSSAWFTFVSWDRFYDTRPWHHRLHHSRVTQIINNTTIVNNIVTGDNNTIINRGVPVDFVRRHAGTEIRQVAVRTLTDSKPVPTGRGEWLEQGGRTLAVRRLAAVESPSPDAAPPGRTREHSRVHPSPIPAKGATALDAPSPARPERLALRRESVTPAVTPQRPGNERPEIPLPSRETPATRTAPLILRGESRSEQPTTPVARPQPASPIAPSEPTVRDNPPAAPKSPSSSVVIIGRRETQRPVNPGSPQTRSGTLGRNEPAGSTHFWASPRTSENPANAPAPRVDVSRPSPSRTVNPQPLSRPASPSVRVERFDPPRVVPSAPSSGFAAPRPESPRIQMSAPPAPAAPPVRTFSAPAPPASRAPFVAPSHPAPSLGPAPMRSSPSFSPPAAPSVSPGPGRDFAPSRGGGESRGRTVREF